MERGLAIVPMLRPGLGRTPSPDSWDTAARPLSSGAAASKASCKNSSTSACYIQPHSSGYLTRKTALQLSCIRDPGSWPCSICTDKNKGCMTVQC